MVRNWIALSGFLAAACSLQALEPAAQKLASRYEEILSGNPTQSTALDRLWQIHAAASETDGLLETWRVRAEGNSPASAIYAQLLVRGGHQEQAAAAFAQAAALDPSDARWQVLHAECLASLSRSAEAEKILAQAAGDFPNDSRPLIRLGEMQAARGDQKAALASWEAAVGRVPGDLELRRKVAQMFAAAGEFQKAISHERAIAENSATGERLRSLQNIVGIAGKGGDLPAAIHAQEQVLELLGPGHWQRASAVETLLALCEREGSLPARERLWLAQAEARPRDAAPAVQMAAFYAFSGREEKRREWLQKALAILPEDPALLRELSDVELGLGRAAEAVRLRERLLEMQPEETDSVFLLAEAEAISGREKPAGERIEKLLESHAGNTELEARALEFFRRLHLNDALEKRLAAKAAASPLDAAATLDYVAWLVQRRRGTEAEEACRRLDQANLPAQEKAAAAGRFGDLFANAGYQETAETWLERALAQDPANPDQAVALAEVFLANGKTRRAIDVLETCIAGQKEKLPPEDLDRLLFTSLQSLRAADPIMPLLPGAISPETSAKIRALRDSAAKKPSEARWLRLARWQRWTNDGRQAADSLQSALILYPGSLTLRETLAAVAAESGQHALALEQFKEIASRHPDQAGEMRRRTANVETDRGNADEALKIFQQLASEQPSDWHAVADLAVAEQRAGNWFRAFETWQRAVRLAPPDSRRGLRQSLLAAAARLRLHEKALESLEEAARREADPAVKREIFDDALAYARNNRVLELWRAKLEAGRRRSPDDPLWPFGLAALLREIGDAEAAEKLLSSVQPADSESAEQLDLLLQTARQAQDYGKAATLARKIARMKETFPAWADYADILEESGRSNEAAEIWAGLAARFARSPDALFGAAGFFARQGNSAKMRKSLREASRLAEPNPELILRLGELSQQAGDRGQALKDFETVLQIAQPQEKDWETCLPLPARLTDLGSHERNPEDRGDRPNPAFRTPSRESGEGCRLLAIRSMGQLLANSPEGKNWLESAEWQSRPAIERVWALYFGGDTEKALKLAGDILSREKPSPEACVAMAGMALESGAAAFLSQWASRQDAIERWSGVLAAFDQMIKIGWRPSAEFLRELFAEAPATAGWRAAQILAADRRLEAAIIAAQPALDRLPKGQQCAAWLAIGNWQLSLRDIPGAEKSYEAAVDSALPTADFSQPVFSAIRQRWLLAEPRERNAVAQRLFAAAGRTGHAGFLAAARALLQGLENAPRPDLHEVVARIGLGEEESWAMIVQQGGWQLESWGLDRMARGLYREYLREDPGLHALRGELPLRRTTETLLLISKFSSARPPELPVLLQEWIARQPRQEDLLLAASRLASRPEAALALHKEILRRTPGNDAVLASMITGPAATRRCEKIWPLVKERLASQTPTHGRALPANAGLPLAEWLGKNGRVDDALSLYEALRSAEPGNIAALRQQAGLLCRVGRFQDALRLLEPAASSSHDSQLSLQYAGLLAQLGREAQAMAFLEGRRTSGRSAAILTTCALMDLQRQTGDEVGARRTEKKLQRLAENETPEWTASSLRHSPASFEEDFSKRRYVLLNASGLPEKFRRTELRRLKAISAGNPRLQAGYYAVRRELARRTGSLEMLKAELKTEWDSGKGSYPAGEALVQIALEEGQKDELRGLVDELLSARDFPDTAWSGLALQLLRGNEPQQAMRIYERLAGEGAGDPERALFHAEALWKCGKKDQAATVVSPVARIARADPRLHFPLAAFYLETARPELAETHLRELPVRNDLPQQAAGSLWERFAMEMIKAGRPADAAGALKKAGEVGANPPVSGWAAYDVETGNQPADPMANSRDLPLDAWRNYRVEVIILLLKKNDAEGAWRWLEADPELLQSPAARAPIATLAQKDPDRAIRLWRLARQSPLLEIRNAGADFLFDQAGKLPEDRRLALLKEAHKGNPSSLEIAQMLAQASLKAGQPEAARRALQEVIDSPSAPEDRRKARKLLDSLALSDALPRKG